MMQRRQFMGTAAIAGLAASLPASAFAADTAGLPNLAAKAVPIGAAERQARIAKATQLLRALAMDALLIEPGSSLIYFTGVRWSRSERLTAAVLTREGDVAIVTPFFEEPSVRESLGIDAEVLTWNEDENPLAAVAAWLDKRGLAKGRIGVEETVRYFAVDGLEKAMPGATVVNGAPVVRGCRMHKSAAEIALMQIAADITIAAYRHTAPRVEAGMTPADIGAIMAAATRALGGKSEFELILLGEASAYPHGSGKPRSVSRRGRADGPGRRGSATISRTFRAALSSRQAARQRQVWDQMRKGQDVALAAAKLGTPAGKVDDAVRAYYAGLGCGPDYKLPGLSHRTGHGIGMDGHEPVNLVRGETTKLAPGMCFLERAGHLHPGRVRDPA